MKFLIESDGPIHVPSLPRIWIAVLLVTKSGIQMALVSYLLKELPSLQEYTCPSMF